METLSNIDKLESVLRHLIAHHAEFERDVNDFRWTSPAGFKFRVHSRGGLTLDVWRPDGQWCFEVRAVESPSRLSDLLCELKLLRERQVDLDEVWRAHP